MAAWKQTAQQDDEVESNIVAWTSMSMAGTGYKTDPTGGAQQGCCLTGEGRQGHNQSQPWQGP